MAEKKSFVLRMSPELWDALQALASEDFRSVNGEIEFILTDYAKRRGRLSRATPVEPDQEG